MNRKGSTRLPDLLDTLEEHYGAPKAPRGVKTAFEWVLWEKIGYLANDEKRAKAFHELKATLGTRPNSILGASTTALAAIACGVHPIRSAEEMRLCGDIAEREHSGDVDAFLDREPKRALAALKKYPGIGEPGAEKILLFTQRAAIPALESNGLRVLVRLGFAIEARSYAATYKAVRAAILPQCKLDWAWLTRMHRLLRTHGQELCKNSRPNCDACALESNCEFARKS